MFKVKPLDAKFMKDNDVFSQMDPYAIFECNGKKFQTRADRDGGKHPQWTEEFIIKTKDIKEKVLKVTTYDDDPIKDDYLGGGDIQLDMWFENPRHLKIHELRLMDKQKQTGMMRIQYFYDPDVEPQEQTRFIL